MKFLLTLVLLLCLAAGCLSGYQHQSQAIPITQAPTAIHTMPTVNTSSLLHWNKTRPGEEVFFRRIGSGYGQAQDLGPVGSCQNYSINSYDNGTHFYCACENCSWHEYQDISLEDYAVVYMRTRQVLDPRSYL